MSTIKILFEDDNYLVIDKPAGMLVHSDGKTKGENVTDWLSKKYPALENVGGEVDVQNSEPVKRWGFAHRIDRETSGILVVAKTQNAFEDIQEKFQNRKVKKTYYAFVYGRVTIDHQVIDSPIGRSKTDFRRWTVGADARGVLREAVTEYRVVHKTNEVTFVEVKPKTGRTHQIRVHLRSVGNPVVCDSVYAPLRKGVLDFKRLALHAKSVSFESISGEQISVSAPYPPDFTKALETLGIQEKFSVSTKP
jgi:23S rRNA pseudouridine1911/1915/1917 synthase